MKVNSDEITEYISKILLGVEKGLGENFYIKDSISFDLAVVNKKDAGGGIRAHIVDLGGKYKTSEVQRVKFEVRKKLDEEAIHDFPKENGRDWRIGK